MKFEPMRAKGFRHPSGRPLRKSQYGIISRPKNIPDDPLTPGLRQNERTEAIGFMTDFPLDEDEEDFDYTREAE
jgi:hypothetical protein